MKFKLLYILGLLVLILMIVAAFIFLDSKKKIYAPNEKIEKNTIIEIESGKGSKEIGSDLERLGLVSNGKIFYYASIVLSKKINHGFYELTPGMSISDILNLVDSGKVKVVKVLIPEGLRVEQIARKLDEAGIVTYEDFLTKAKDKEGKLFPDTYFFNPRMTADEIITMMLDDYNQRIAGINISDNDLILASIVEREAADDADRGLIAGIYSNRLKAGMKLQSDPTVEYGRDSNEIAKLSVSDQKSYTFWKSAKTVEYTSVKSSYNTYQISALPLGPICNPGLKSIEAAKNPTPSKYYYFLYGRDGKLYPSSNSTEHEALAAKYLW
jgi:UPF0755 protein